MILKGVSHLHTNYSYDGKLSIQDLKDFLLKNDIDFALISEHSDYIVPHQAKKFIEDCHNLSDEKITLIPGFEVPYKDAHILMIGVDRFFKNGPNREDELKVWKQHSQIAILAHPHRNKYLMHDAIKEVIDGIEIWNSQYDGILAPRMKALNILTNLVKKGENIFGYAGLDFHREEHIGGPVIVIESLNNQKDIVETLKSGKFAIKTTNTTISSNGEITKGLPALLHIKSKLSIVTIAVSKKISAFASIIHLPIPQKLRSAIRSKL